MNAVNIYFFFKKKENNLNKKIFFYFFWGYFIFFQFEREACARESAKCRSLGPRNFRNPDEIKGFFHSEGGVCGLANGKSNFIAKYHTISKS